MRTDCLSLDQQNDRYQAQNQSNEPEQGRCPVEPQSPVHGRRGERQKGAGDVAAHRRGGEGRSGVFFVGVGEIVDDGKVDTIHSDTDAAKAQSGDDPVEG